jgi:small-conductance mechanosensitive channel
MSQKLRRKITFYVPGQLAERYQDLAAREGISLSAYLVKALAAEDRIDDLQGWLAGRFERIEARLSQAPSGPSDEQLLALAGLGQLPHDLLLGILRDVRQEIDGMTPKQREHYSAKGRELLAQQQNGAVK